MTLQETKDAMDELLARKQELMLSSQKMADPQFNSIDAAQWATIHEDDAEEIATITAALHWLNQEISDG